MSINANNVKIVRKATQKEILPVGAYPVRLVGIATLGLRPQMAFKGVEKPPAVELRLTYEFLDEFMNDEDGNPDETKPRWLTEKMSFRSLKSTEAKSTARYLAFDPTQEHEGDWEKLIGSPGILTLVHNKGNNGIIYENVDRISSMRPKEASKAPDLVNPTFVFDFYSPTIEGWNRLPNWLQEYAKESLDYKGGALERFVNNLPEEKEEEEVEETKVEKKVSTKAATKTQAKLKDEVVDEAEEEQEDW